MRKLILHIGRHKSGTTAIQQFLFRNPDLLRRFGYSYPAHGAIGFAHHEIAGTLMRTNMRQSGKTDAEIIQETRKLIARLVDGCSSVPVLSSEAFQNCEPAIVRAALADYDVRVIVYLREPVSYLISAYTQRVHASNYTGTIEAYASEIFKDSYKPFIDDWYREFGSSLSVRVYARRELLQQDIVLDFCESILGVDSAAIQACYRRGLANKSLSASLLHFKLWLNQFESLPPKPSRQVYQGLEELATIDKSAPICLSEELVRKIETQFTAGNKEIAKQYLDRAYLFEPYERPKVQSGIGLGCRNIAMVRENLITVQPELARLLPKSPQLLQQNPGRLHVRPHVRRHVYSMAAHNGHDVMASRSLRSIKALSATAIGTTPPKVTMQLPPSGILTAGSYDFSGEVYDDAGTGIKSIRFCIRSHSENLWYNFANNSFTGAVGNGASAATLSNTTLTYTNWNSSAELAAGEYTVGVKAVSYGGGVSPWEFKRLLVLPVGSQKPTTAFQTPNGETLTPGMNSFSGTATVDGGCGFKFVKVCIRNLTLDQWYNCHNASFTGAAGNGAFSAELSDISVDSTEWSCLVSLPVGDYKIGVRAFSGDGNRSNWMFKQFSVVAHASQSDGACGRSAA